MPVKFDKNKNKWCVGTKCIYTSREKALEAYKAYLVKKSKKT